MNDQQRLELEAAAFRRLVAHLDSRKDVQNIDLMNLSGFCRNCLSKWYKAEADERQIELSLDDAREVVYGMPYAEWKAQYQKKPAPTSRPRLPKEKPMTDLNILRASLDSGEHVFADTLAFVAAGYDYQPQAFTNGDVENAAGQNEGSCKTLGLALLEGLSDQQALLAFGEHYRSVVATPEGSDHGNIRALMTHGLAGVKFAAQPLTRR